MSATLNGGRFAQYFGETVRMPGETTKIKIPAPIIDIDSKPYSVIEYHMDSILSIEGIGSVSMCVYHVTYSHVTSMLYSQHAV